MNQTENAPAGCVFFACSCRCAGTCRRASGSYTASMNTQQGSELFSAIVAAPFGAIGIRTEDGRRARTGLPAAALPGKSAAGCASPNRPPQQVARYFDDRRFPLRPAAGGGRQRVPAPRLGRDPRDPARQRAHLRPDRQAARIGAARGRPGLRRQLVPAGDSLPPRDGQPAAWAASPAATTKTASSSAVKRWLLRHEGALALEMPWQQQSIFP